MTRTRIQSKFVAGIHYMLSTFFPVPCLNFSADAISSGRCVNELLFVIKPARHFTVHKLRYNLFKKSPENQPTHILEYVTTNNKMAPVGLC